MPKRMTIYSTAWCGYCHRLMKQLDREGVAYTTVDIEHDPDVGAWFVKAKGWGENQFSRELSIKACEQLHKALGGKDS